MSTHERRVVLTWRRCSRAGGDHRRGCSRRISAPAPPPTETPGGGTTPAGRPGPQTRRSHPSSTAPPTGAPSSTAPDLRPTRTARTVSNRCSTTEKTTSAVHSLPESRTPAETSAQSRRTGPVSHITWCTEVAHHPAQDRAQDPCVVRTFLTASRPGFPAQAGPRHPSPPRARAKS
jgi:hypothetical protein